MASSSYKKCTCFYCQVETTESRKGWQLRDGGFANLCDSCSSAYENGTFCENFHMDANGWRSCSFCGKMVHCGCIMSYNIYDTLDFGGVGCAQCSVESIQAPNQYYVSSNTTSEFSGIGALSDSSIHLLAHKTTLQSVSPGSPCQVQSPVAQLKKVLNKSSLNEAEIPCDFVVGNQTSQGETSADITLHTSRLPKIVDEEGNEISQGKALVRTCIHPRNLPKTSKEDLQQISRVSKSVLVPLFEKLLSASDCEPKTARLVLPKRCAEAFFPRILDGQGYSIKIQDIAGKDWKFHFRFWQNTNSKMYVLEGTKAYMAFMQWQIGDIVTFYRKEPEGNLVIGTKKASSKSATS